MTSTLKSVLAASAALALAQASASAQAVLLNEIYALHAGSDIYEMIELKGTPGLSLDGYVVCVIEGEGTTGAAGNQGKLDRAYDLSGLAIPASGYFLMGDPAVTGTDYTMAFLGTGQDELENGTETFYLMDAGSVAGATAIVAAIGLQLDPDVDQVTTLPTMGTVVDIIAMTDDANVNTSATSDYTMDGALLTASPGSTMPAGIFRCQDAPNPWCPDALAFDPIVNMLPVPRTPGTMNNDCPTVPCSSGTPPVNYCTAGTTTSGCTAIMSATGTPSLAATSGFVVNVSTVEGQKQGIIFYGQSGPVATPWGIGGTSYLCVKSPTQRSAAQNTGGTAASCNGAMSLDLLAYLNANPGAIGGASSASPFLAGQKCWLQGWFRDPPAVKTTSLSDGLEITFVP